MVGRFCIAVTFSASLAITQITTTPAIPAPKSTPAIKTKPAAFDVVTIKPARPNDRYHFGFGDTGYSAVGVPLLWVINQAYFAPGMNTGESVVGAPDWVNKDKWDIETKVAPEDMAQYQRDLMSTDIANPITRQMLQTMLANRCKFVVHRVPAEMPGFAIEIGKNGPKLTPAAPDEPQPSGSIPLAGGGFVVPWHRGDKPTIKFYSVSMSTFAAYLRMIGRPVIDRTGLTGKYDLSLTWLSLAPDEREGTVSFDDPFPLSHWNFGALGLRVERAQIPTEQIVIDHIEKPSEN
jgi:uncharacterized protein (TIGR03435 family)